MRSDFESLLADLRAEQAELRALVTGADLTTATPATGWDVRDTISHLAGTDDEAVLAVSDPDAFVAKLPAVARDIDGFLAGQLACRRSWPAAELLAEWQEGGNRLLAALASCTPTARLPWYGPAMSPASFTTARLMEYWAHGQDIADALQVLRVPTDRLRHICHLGYRTRAFAYLNRGRPAPPTDVRLELTGPAGASWTYGPSDAQDQVTGAAQDFCLLVTQRRHRSELALTAAGPHAEQWLAIAQCFAGPPGPGRPAP